MSDNSIRSQTEAIDGVVRQYASDIEVFKNDVSGQMAELDAAMGRLSLVWEGSLHDKFEEKMRERQGYIYNTLRRTEALKDKLDEVAAEMAAMLAFLDQAGEDL